jgi:hypothetical protein
LRNTKTGDLYNWTGSFQPLIDNPANITPFQDFVPATFVNQSIADLENVEEKLIWTGPETSYIF